jgi:hypothetical protein
MFCPILDDWQKFLSSECDDYPEDSVTKDAKLLAEQKLGPNRFESLIKLFNDGNPIFYENFKSIPIGNLVCFLKLNESTHL